MLFYVCIVLLLNCEKSKSDTTVFAGTTTVTEFEEVCLQATAENGK